MARAYKKWVVLIGDKMYVVGDTVSFTTKDGTHWNNVKILDIGEWVSGVKFIKFAGVYTSELIIDVAHIDDKFMRYE